MYIEGTIPNRQEDEKLLLFLRRHWIILVGKWLMYLFFGLIPIAIYYFLLYAYPFVLKNIFYFAFLLLLASIYYLFMVLFFFNAFIDYHLDVWIVTNKRIIDIEQKGLFNRVISEQTIEKIQDVAAIQKGIFPTFFNYGTVQVQTAGKIERFLFYQIPKPFDVVKTINELIKEEEENLEQEIHEIIHHENNQ
jgi:membrane protein YdbS with pleckstrin-like domain